MACAAAVNSVRVSIGRRASSRRLPCTPSRKRTRPAAETNGRTLAGPRTLTAAHWREQCRERREQTLAAAHSRQTRSSAASWRRAPKAEVGHLTLTLTLTLRRAGRPYSRGASA
jgi:hypothetical protein